MESDPQATELRKSKRRWFQFSLRSLLVFILIAGLAFGWLGRKIERKRNERSEVASLVKSGFRIAYDYEFLAPKSDDINKIPLAPLRPGPAWLRAILGEDFFSDVYAVAFCCGELSDADIANLEKLSEIRSLGLVQTNLTPGTLAKLQALPHLQSLLFSMSRFTDTGMPSFKGLVELRKLDFEDTNVADSSLISVEGMTGLRSLSLERTRISDAGLVHLKGCSGLETLNLSRTAITDAGLISLEGLRNLSELDVRFTNITLAGKKRLQMALPNCSIMGDYYQFRDSESAPGKR